MTFDYPPSREQMREVAAETAEVRVSALLQAFAMPNITEEQIRQLLVDVVTTSYVSGFAAGWDSALDQARETIETVDRFRRPG